MTNNSLLEPGLCRSTLTSSPSSFTSDVHFELHLCFQPGGSRRGREVSHGTEHPACERSIVCEMESLDYGGFMTDSQLEAHSEQAIPMLSSARKLRKGSSPPSFRSSM